MEWEQKLIDFLEVGSLMGRTRQEISRHVGAYATTAEIDGYLEMLWSEDRVQRFQVPTTRGGKKKMTVWRATTEIRGH